MTTHDTPLLPRMAVGSKTGVNRLKTKMLLVSGGGKNQRIKYLYL